MSNLPPNPYNNIAGAPNVGTFPGQQVFNQLPPSQPHYGLKQDANSNSPIHGSNAPQGPAHNMNNFSQSSNSSPAFNRPGILPPSLAGVSASLLPPVKPNPILAPSPNQFLPHQALVPSFQPIPNANTPTPYPPNYPIQQGKQINDNTPPLIPSSQAYQSIRNGPLGPSPMMPPSSAPQTGPYPPSSRAFSPPVSRPPVSSHNFGPPGSVHQVIGPLQPGTAPLPPKPGPPPPTQPDLPFSGPTSATNVLLRNSPIIPGPPVSGTVTAGPLLGPPRPLGVNGAATNSGMPAMSQAVPLMSHPGPPMSQAGPSTSQSGPPMDKPGPPMSQPGPPMTQAGSSSSQPGPPMNQTGPISQPGPPMSQAGPSMNQPPMSQHGSPMSQQGPPLSQHGPPMSQHGPMNQAGPPLGPQKGQMMGLPLLGPLGPQNIRPPSGAPSLGFPPTSASYSSVSNGPFLMGPPLIGQPAGPLQKGLTTGPPLGPLGQPNPLQTGLQSGPQSLQGSAPTGPQVGPLGPQPPPLGLQAGPQSLAPNMPPMGPMAGPPKSNMQNRYPAMPQANFSNQTPQMHPQQYNTQQMTQQMGNLSVTRQGFDQLWGHHTVDLMQCRHILPEYPEDPPEIKLGHQFADAPNCSPDIFRCTVNRIPENNSLLQKSRLPLGILIHPFKDLNHLPVIQCATIVRCRACRTYINPFVYFVDSKRWKCNLCYRVNDLPEEFQYDPVSKSYGDPSRRPEIKSATIEFIAPGEYMLRPPQPAVYLFLLDVSQLARESHYLDVVCKTLQENLDQLPGDARTQVGFICFDAHIHYYLMSEGLTRPKEMTVLDIDDVFLPSPESLLVNLGERRAVVSELLSALPARHSGPGAPASALGAALQAAYKLMAPTGGRITVFQTCLPNAGPGALTPREDPNARSGKEVAHLNPATDFYKRIALDCSGAQVAVDLFLLNSQYADLATLSGMSKFSGGSVQHVPLFSAARGWQAARLRRALERYLTRKIGFEAVMRVRCTRGISIHTFHGNFFVRSTDLLSLPNVSPDAGFGMQLTIEESLADLQQVCFQAALLYTSSKGERRIRVHTMALPIASTLPDVLHAADQQCIIGLLSKMAVDRCVSASMSEAREAITNVAIDVLSAFRLAQNLPAGAASNSLHAPMSLRLLPLFLLALLKRKAFRTGTSTRLDDRVADMCNMKTLPLQQLLRAVYPDLFPVHQLSATEDGDPPALQLSAEKVNSTGAYLLDDGETMILYVGHAVSPAYLSETFGVASFSQLPDEARALPKLDTDGNQLLHLFIEKLNEDRPYPSSFLLLRDNSPSRLEFTERLVDDRVESSFSYYEFLQHVKSQVK